MTKTLEKKKIVIKGVGKAAILAAYKIELTPVALARIKDIEEAREALQQLAVDASGIAIKDDDTNQKAAQAVVDLSKGAKYLEELRKFFKGPLLEAGKRVDGSFAEWTAAASKEESRLRRATGDWFMAQKAIADKAEEDRQAQLKKDQAKARGLGREAPAAPPPFVAPAPTVRTEGGSLNIRTEWIFDPNQIEIDKVPDQYKMVNPKAVRAALDAGVRSIPGLVIKEVPVTTAR